MNVFALSPEPWLAATWHSDVHVNSQLREGTQLLCTYVHVRGWDSDGLYKPTHPNHLCSRWLRESPVNCRWLHELVWHLNMEFVYRGSGADHASLEVADRAWEVIKSHENCYKGKLTDWAQSVDKKYVSEDPIKSYIEYYRNEKRMLRNSQKRLVPATWTKRDPPPWWSLPEEFNQLDEDLALF